MATTNFACTQSNSYASNCTGCKAFDGNKNIGQAYRWQINSVSLTTWYSLTWYNPLSYNIKSLIIYNNEANYVAKAYQLYSGNELDNYNTLLEEGTNTITTASSSWKIDTSTNNNFYKYHQLKIQPNNTSSVQIGEIEITGTVKL